MVSGVRVDTHDKRTGMRDDRHGGHSYLPLHGCGHGRHRPAPVRVEVTKGTAL